MNYFGPKSNRGYPGSDARADVSLPDPGGRDAQPAPAGIATVPGRVPGERVLHVCRSDGSEGDHCGMQSAHEQPLLSERCRHT